jgi:hypothetical protein
MAARLDPIDGDGEPPTLPTSAHDSLAMQKVVGSSRSFAWKRAWKQALSLARPSDRPSVQPAPPTQLATRLSAAEVRERAAS